MLTLPTIALATAILSIACSIAFATLELRRPERG